MSRIFTRNAKRLQLVENDAEKENCIVYWGPVASRTRRALRNAQLQPSPILSAVSASKPLTNKKTSRKPLANRQESQQEEVCTLVRYNYEEEGIPRESITKLNNKPIETQQQTQCRIEQLPKLIAPKLPIPGEFHISVATFRIIQNFKSIVIYTAVADVFSSQQHESNSRILVQYIAPRQQPTLLKLNSLRVTVSPADTSNVNRLKEYFQQNFHVTDLIRIIGYNFQILEIVSPDYTSKSPQLSDSTTMNEPVKLMKNIRTVKETISNFVENISIARNDSTKITRSSSTKQNSSSTGSDFLTNYISSVRQLRARKPELKESKENSAQTATSPSSKLTSNTIVKQKLAGKQPRTVFQSKNSQKAIKTEVTIPGTIIPKNSRISLIWNTENSFSSTPFGNNSFNWYRKNDEFVPVIIPDLTENLRNTKFVPYVPHPIVEIPRKRLSPLALSLREFYESFAETTAADIPVQSPQQTIIVSPSLDLSSKSVERKRKVPNDDFSQSARTGAVVKRRSISKQKPQPGRNLPMSSSLVRLPEQRSMSPNILNSSLVIPKQEITAASSVKQIENFKKPTAMFSSAKLSEYCSITVPATPPRFLLSSTVSNESSASVENSNKHRLQNNFAFDSNELKPVDLETAIPFTTVMPESIEMIDLKTEMAYDYNLSNELVPLESLFQLEHCEFFQSNVQMSDIFLN